MTQFTVHTSTLFDPKLQRVRHNVSITVDSTTGLIIRVYERQDAGATSEPLPEGDVDLRGKYVMPGLVDAHTHVFLHSYE
jgi:imidazolonepropionase-like amidohydrolase